MQFFVKGILMFLSVTLCLSFCVLWVSCQIGCVLGLVKVLGFRCPSEIFYLWQQWAPSPKAVWNSETFVYDPMYAKREHFLQVSLKITSWGDLNKIPRRVCILDFRSNFLSRVPIAISKCSLCLVLDHTFMKWRRSSVTNIPEFCWHLRRKIEPLLKCLETQAWCISELFWQ